MNINQISVHQKLVPNVPTFPARDWYIVEATTSRHLSKSPRISFKILSWICLIGQKWHDIVTIKKWKQSNNICFHPHIFCKCAMLFLKQDRQTYRPFSPEFQLDRMNNKFIQVSPECEQLLINTGLKIASVLCSDISGAPSLPKVFGNFTVSKMFFNNYFCYILHG